MELTKEYFDQKFAAIISYINENLVTKKEFENQITLFKDHIDTNFVSKEYLDERLNAQTKMLMGYTHDIADCVIEATDQRFDHHESQQTQPVRKLFVEAMDKKGLKWYNR